MVDPKRLNEELRRLKHLINTDPRVKARFDKDGNGVIDGDVWEEVRQLVIRRLERGDAEANAAAGATPGAGGAPTASPSEAESQVAEQLFAEDLQPLPLDAISPGSAGQHSVLILEQEGGLGQVFEGMQRRSYSVHAPDGRAIARIEQVESELLQGFTQRGFSIPDLHFRVLDQISGEQLLLQKSESMSSGTRIAVVNAKGGEIAHAQFRGRFLEREIMAHSSLVALGLRVKRRLLKPWTYDIETELDEKVGSIERGWSGLGGFLTGGNRMRIHVETGRATPELMWALVAAGLMFDLAQESDRSPDAGIRLGS